MLQAEELAFVAADANKEPPIRNENADGIQFGRRLVLAVRTAHRAFPKHRLVAATRHARRAVSQRHRKHGRGALTSGVRQALIQLLHRIRGPPDRIGRVARTPLAVERVAANPATGVEQHRRNIQRHPRVAPRAEHLRGPQRLGRGQERTVVPRLTLDRHGQNRLVRTRIDADHIPGHKRRVKREQQRVLFAKALFDLGRRRPSARNDGNRPDVFQRERRVQTNHPVRREQETDRLNTRLALHLLAQTRTVEAAAVRAAFALHIVYQRLRQSHFGVDRYGDGVRQRDRSRAVKVRFRRTSPPSPLQTSCGKGDENSQHAKTPPSKRAHKNLPCSCVSAFPTTGHSLW